MYCHQCHHKIEGIFASCKKQTKGKFCNIKYCEKCLWNRYKEKAEEVTLLETWCCPKCRGSCNCCMCRRKQGPNSSGKVPTAEASGSSAPKLVGEQGPLNLDPAEGISSTSNWDKKKRRRVKGGRESNVTGIEDGSSADVVLPQGTEVTQVAGINLASEDIGQAIQFLEFCAAFGEILDLKEGQPESILKELACGGRASQGKFSLSVHFNELLLSILQEDLEENTLVTPQTGKNSWLHDLRRFATRSSFIPQVLNLEQLCTSDGYDKLNFSQKIRILNILCDEILNKKEIKSWIDEKSKKEQGKVLPVMLPTVKQGPNVFRRQPIRLGVNGRICWRLNCCNDASNLFIEEVGSSDGRPEKWLTYNVEEEKEMERYLVSARKRKKSRKVVVDDTTNNAAEDEETIRDSSSNNEQ